VFGIGNIREKQRNSHNHAAVQQGRLACCSGRLRAGTDLRLVDLEDFTPHYARTLAEWRRNLDRAGDRLERWTDERFRRLWYLHLAYCEGGFAERHTGLVQMVLARGAWRGQVSRAEQKM
jgi:hypothetical protein